MNGIIDRCRICGNTELVSVIDLGQQCLTGVFPKSQDEKVPLGPLELVKCQDDDGGQFCGLLQLRYSHEKTQLYGDNYGYRSGLNSAMVGHLKDIVEKICRSVALEPGDLIIDIGSNDGTLLGLYPNKNFLLAGVDPTAGKFSKFYANGIKLINDFFSSQAIKNAFGDRRAKVVSSIAMFYDLDSPLDFIRQINEILDNDGIWVLEQSYMPLMLHNCAYDTICHEHLEYYALKQIKWMLDKVGFKVLDLDFNDTNGGSLQLIVTKKGSPQIECSDRVKEVLDRERDLRLATLSPFDEFRGRVKDHREKLISMVRGINRRGQRIFGYGASTKGNVILQYCGFTQRDIPYIAEVNEDKFGAYTPNTGIPIISERQAKTMNPDYFLVLPWHFRDNFLKKEKEYLKAGGKFIFPLPEIDIVGYEDTEPTKRR